MSAPPVLFEAKVMTRAANLSHLGIPQNLTIRYASDREASKFEKYPEATPPGFPCHVIETK